MNRYFLFWKIFGRSLLLGLQAGAGLGLATGLFFALIGGLWAIVLGLGYGCALGLALGLVNGLLLACIISLFFFPPTHSKGLRWVTQTGSVATSLLITIALMRIDANWNNFSWSIFAAIPFLPVIMLPCVGAAAWWASCRVDDWYETYYLAGPEPSKS